VLPVKSTRPDFRKAASQRLSEEGGQLSSALEGLLFDEADRIAVRVVRLGDVHLREERAAVTVDPAALERLTASIAQVGVIEPLFVRPRPAGGYEVMSGERRWRAARELGVAVVPVVIREIDDVLAAGLEASQDRPRAAPTAEPGRDVPRSPVQMPATWPRRTPTVISGPGIPLRPQPAPEEPPAASTGVRPFPRLGPLLRRNRA
jgi:hypothetical protein